jgi:hypothetical protein
MPRPIPVECGTRRTSRGRGIDGSRIHGRATEKREYGFDHDRRAKRWHVTIHISRAAPVASGALIFRFSDEAALRMERSGFFHH